MLGKPIPKKLRANMAADPFYKTCARNEALNDHICEANPLNGQLIEWEHAIIYKGNKLQEKWAIIPICYKVHRGGLLDKNINIWIALNRASPDELAAHSKAVDLKRERDRLNAIYGPYEANRAVVVGPGTTFSRYVKTSELNY